jgi:hypothetical protein
MWFLNITYFRIGLGLLKICKDTKENSHIPHTHSPALCICISMVGL